MLILLAEWGDIRSTAAEAYTVYEQSIEMELIGLSRKVSHKILKWVEKQIPTTKLESELKKFRFSWISKSPKSPPGLIVIGHVWWLCSLSVGYLVHSFIYI